MREITEKYKQQLAESKEIDKQIKELEKKRNKLTLLKKDIYKCPNKKCGALFEEVEGMDSPYNEYYLPAALLSDKNIVFEPGERRQFMDWTTGGWDIYEADTVKMYFVCPKCGKKYFIRTVRKSIGTFIESRDA